MYTDAILHVYLVGFPQQVCVEGMSIAPLISFSEVESLNFVAAPCRNLLSRRNHHRTPNLQLAQGTVLDESDHTISMGMLSLSKGI